MAGQESSKLSRLPSDIQLAQPKTSSTYDTLMRQSKKLGRTATRTFGEVRQNTRQMLRKRKRKSDNVADHIKDLKKAVAHSREVLASAKTIPSFLFPDEICLDRTKITVTRRNFFWSSDEVSIRIEDVLNVSGVIGPLFGSVTVTSRVMSSVDHYTVERFWRGDAIELKQIIQGYLLARQNGLATDHLGKEQLVETLHELGQNG